jgi:hypothetical protein
MTNQKQANDPAAGRLPGGAEDRNPARVSGPDVPSGMSFDYIDEALEETMVASDPPALTPQTTVGPPSPDATRRGGQGRRD